MNCRLIFATVFLLAARITVAQQLPPPANPAPAKPPTPPQGPALVAPQNAAQNNPAAQAAEKPAGKPPEFFKARRAALAAHKEAQMQRMRDFKAARAEADEKAYQDWHERYLADTPVREQYFRALASYYDSGSAVANIRAAYPYGWGPPIVLPVYAPIYAPICAAPIYGTFIYWGW